LIEQTNIVNNLTKADGTKKNQIVFYNLVFAVPRTRLELAHPCEHQPLKLACLPISPPGRVGSELRAQSREFMAQGFALCPALFALRFCLCPEQDSNLHIITDTSP
jgi:hypothetical protein